MVRVTGVRFNALFCHTCLKSWPTANPEAWSGHCPGCGGILYAHHATKRKIEKVVRDGERSPRRKRKTIKQGKRQRIFQRDGFKCLRCGEQDRSKLTLDHIVKWSDGGSNKDENLRTLCGDCNRKRDVWERLEGALS